MIRHRETDETDLSPVLFLSAHTFQSHAPSPGLGGVDAQSSIPDTMPVDAGSSTQTTIVLQAGGPTPHPAAAGAWSCTLASPPRARANWGAAPDARPPSTSRVMYPVPHPALDALSPVARGGEWGVENAERGVLKSEQTSPPSPVRPLCPLRRRSTMRWEPCGRARRVGSFLRAGRTGAAGDGAAVTTGGCATETSRVLPSGFESRGAQATRPLRKFQWVRKSISFRLPASTRGVAR